MNLSPSQQQLNSLIEQFKKGQFDEAEKLAVSITKQFPDHQFTWKILGVILGQTGRKAEALNANQKAVVLGPQDALAHNNLATTLKELGKLEEAEASYRQAIVFKPDLLEAHSDLGKLLMKKGQHQEGLNEQIIGDGIINFDLRNGLSI